MDRQSHSIDLQWVSFVVLMILYCTQAVHDWTSAVMFNLILLFYAGVLPKKIIILSIQFLLWAEAALKSPFSDFDPEKYQLDMNCMNAVMNGKIRPDTSLWMIVNIFSLLMSARTVCGSDEPPPKKWGPLMTQIMVYTLPIFLYLFNLMTTNQGLRMAWAGLACLQILHLFPMFNHLMCCSLVTFYIFMDSEIPQYSIVINGQTIPGNQTKNIVRICFFLMMILINVYSNPHPQYKQDSKKQEESWT